MDPSAERIMELLRIGLVNNPTSYLRTRRAHNTISLAKEACMLEEDALDSATNDEDDHSPKLRYIVTAFRMVHKKYEREFEQICKQLQAQEIEANQAMPKLNKIVRMNEYMLKRILTSIPHHQPQPDFPRNPALFFTQPYLTASSPQPSQACS